MLTEFVIRKSPAYQEWLWLLHGVEGNIVDATVTDENGNYEFTDLMPGSYYISVNNDPNYYFSPVVEGGNQVQDTVEAPYFNSSPIITLNYGDNDMTLLVGMYELVTVGDQVWNDRDGNGILDNGESGMPNITATLLDSNGTAITSTTTDANGTYFFTDLVPNGYAVHFSLPEGYVFTEHYHDNHDHTHSAVVNEETGTTNVTFLTSGEVETHYDAGMFQKVCINGTTWHDLNANGVQDEGEPVLESVMITLYRSDMGGRGQYQTDTWTDANGYWGL